MKRRNKDNKALIELELDGYETASVTEDFSDAFDDISLSDGDIAEHGFHNPLYGINITDEYSGFSLPDVQVEDSEDPFKNTELVLKFSHTIRPETLAWFLEKVVASKSHGGAELLLRREPYTGGKNEGMVVHVTATCWRMLEVAELLEIKKLDYSSTSPIPREFKIRELHQFLKGDMESHDILTSAEKQMVVLHELKTLHSLVGERHVPCRDKKLPLIPGQSIFHIFLQTGLIKSYFALHVAEELNRLDNKWFFEFFEDNPYEEIRDYFGDSTCLYFNFVAYYSLWLTFPTVVGLILQVFMWTMPNHVWVNIAVDTFCLVNMVFLTLFLIHWQRFQSTITFKWGTLKMNVWEEARANYWGRPALDPVTGKIQRRFPYRITKLRTYLCSWPLIFILCGLSIWVMYVFLVIEDSVKMQYGGTNSTDRESTTEYYWRRYGVVNLPGVAYALSVITANRYYRQLANALTEWENHRTEAQFERHLIIKLVVFEVTNNFIIFFYTAFVLVDMDLLKRRLFVFLSLVQLYSIVDECLMPLLVRKGWREMSSFLKKSKKTIKNVLRRNSSGSEHLRPKRYPGLENDIEVMAEDDPRVAMSKVEEHMSPFDKEADFDDFLDLFLQFGYIFFFSSVFPAAASFAFACNIGFLWASLFKRREVYQRSLATRVSSIGAWQPAFEVVALLAVITNCALIGLNIRKHFPSFTDWEWTLICFLAEHILIAIQFSVKHLVSKIPFEVKLAIAALEYRSKEAFKREQARNTRRRMTKVFRPINEDLQNKIIKQESRAESLQVKHRRGVPMESATSVDERSPPPLPPALISKNANSTRSKKKAK